MDEYPKKVGSQEQLQAAIADWKHRYTGDYMSIHEDTIKFALRFTAKALAEPSNKVLEAAGTMEGYDGYAGSSDNDHREWFRYVISEIAKECAE